MEKLDYKLKNGWVFSSECSPCVFCGEETGDYINYQLNNITLMIPSHTNCVKKIDEAIIVNSLKQVNREIDFIKYIAK